jgi:hypothetical protein
MESSPLAGDPIREHYDQLVLCASALQLPLSAAEQVEFLTDAIDACDRITTLLDEMEIAKANGDGSFD